MYGNLREQRQQRRRERRQQISSLQIVFVSILAIGMLLAINFSARIRRGQQIDDLQDQIQATIDVELDRNRQLKATQVYVASDESVAAWAHAEGKLVREGEVLVIPVPGEVTPTPIPQARPPEVEQLNEPAAPEEEEYWKLWWSLFFDSEPPDWLE
jgi:hypothetical protein